MKRFQYALMSTVAVAALAFLFCSAAPSQPAKVSTVNFKKCVETSKLGKQEQAAFEALKKQMESVLSEKEKTLNEMASKLEDPDYLDSLSPESETEMKRKFRSLSQEYSAVQQQYLQTLNQTNFKVVQKINDKVAEAASAVAKQSGIDLIVNDETIFFGSPNLDITSQVVSMMDQNFDKEPSKPSSATPAPATK